MANQLTPIEFPAYLVESWIALLKDPTKNDTALRMEGVQIERELREQLSNADRKVKSQPEKIAWPGGTHYHHDWKCFMIEGDPHESEYVVISEDESTRRNLQPCKCAELSKK